jgi:hypothetical protein
MPLITGINFKNTLGLIKVVYVCEPSIREPI